MSEFLPPYPFRSKPPLRESEAISEVRIALANKWGKTRKITDELLRSHGHRIDPADLRRYHEKLKSFEGVMSKTEEGKTAELLFLEGCDEDDSYFQDRKSRRTGPLQWLGIQVVPYKPTEIDDVLHGTDAILMVSDPDEPAKAYPLAVDLKTNARDYGERLINQLVYTLERNREPDQIYWADSKGVNKRFNSPSEGKIEALPMVSYIPREIVQELSSNRTDPAEARHLMEVLGGYIHGQLNFQLNLYLSLLYRTIRMSDLSRSPSLIRPGYHFRYPSVEERQNQARGFSPGLKEVERIASGVLRKFYEDAGELSATG